MQQQQQIPQEETTLTCVPRADPGESLRQEEGVQERTEEAQQKDRKGTVMVGIGYLSPSAGMRQGKAQESLPQEEKTLEEHLAILREEVRKRKRRIYTGILAMFTYYIVVITVAVLLKMGWLMSWLGIFGAVLAGLFVISQKQKDAIEALTEWEDIRAVGALAEALDYKDRYMVTGTRNAGSRAEYRVDYQDGYIYDKIKACLIRLLPKLQSSDADLLSAEQRGSLYRALNGQDTQLSLAILKAFQQVGDLHALPVVEKLARGEGRTAQNIELQQAAQECLPFLIARIENEREQHQLLRASGSSAAAPDTLLRPASGAGQAEAHELLRAGLPESPVQTPVQNREE
ncbi:MAG TPA: hypothetical protein VKU00_29145 [Chthonomonadaceae bacterium]|nr:hypothetical protein [Chthonomonadaceae bacterium]